MGLAGPGQWPVASGHAETTALVSTVWLTCLRVIDRLTER